MTQLAISGQLISRLETDAKFQPHDQIIESLQAINVSSKQISDIQGLLIEMYCTTLSNTIRGRISVLLHNPEARSEIAKLPRGETFDLPTPLP